MTLLIKITELYDLLFHKTGKVDTSLEQKTSILASKEDIAKLVAKIAQTESKLILWAFVFWATQLGATFAFLFIFLRK